MESLYRKRLVMRQRKLDEFDNTTAKMIEFVSKLQALSRKFSRKDDPKTEIRTSEETITFILKLEKYDTKTVWLLIEQVFDYLNLDLVMYSELRTSEKINLYNYRTDPGFDFYITFSKACIPITKKRVRPAEEVEEIIGYTCPD